jgi:hypothetical protein
MVEVVFFWGGGGRSNTQGENDFCKSRTCRYLKNKFIYPFCLFCRCWCDWIAKSRFIEAKYINFSIDYVGNLPWIENIAWRYERSSRCGEISLYARNGKRSEYEAKKKRWINEKLESKLQKTASSKRVRHEPPRLISGLIQTQECELGTKVDREMHSEI